MPKMAGRSSARSSVSRDQPTSPPKQPSDRQSQSPRRTRSGRSRSISVDLGTDDRETIQTRPGKRGTRQGSAESVNSNASAGSQRGGGRTKKTTRAAGRNLSIVAEDREEEQADVNRDDDNGDDSEIEEQGSGQRPIRSPSNVSQMSGTTAFSGATAYSAKEIASIDATAAEKLPELYTMSLRILDLLAPQNASKEQIESIVKDLKISGSRRAKSLKKEEDDFSGVRALYGSESDTYIQMRFIFRKLLGSQTPKEGPFRPDAAIHTANIAAMVKEFLVFPQESPTIRQALMDLESFPEPFIRTFDDHVEFGSSSLLDESFEMALDIRTQFTISALRNALRNSKDQEEFDPDELLTTQFFDEPAEQSQELGSFFDVFTNGRPKGLPRGPALSEPQVVTIKNRVMEIRSTFRDHENAREAGDLVDFEQLEEMFPWLDFLTNLVNWSRTRLDETLQSIEQQGGLENLAKELKQLTQNINNSQAETTSEIVPAATKPRQLAPAAEISQPSLLSKGTVGFLNQLKRGPSSLRASSSNPQVKNPRSSGKNAQSDSRRPDPFSDFMLPPFGDEDEEIFPRPMSSRPTQEYASIVDAYGHERNKENRPGTHSSSRHISGKGSQKAVSAGAQDRSGNAERVRGSGQESVAGPSTQKRSHDDIDEEELSEDEGFEGDKRVPDQSRRRGLPPAHQSARSNENPRPSKRARVNSEDAEEGMVSRTSHGKSRVVQRPSPRYLDEEDEDEDPASPPMTFRQISRVALSQSVKARVATSQTQKRIPWSDEDVEYLTEGIEEYGCKWSLLWKLDGWEVKRDQVALKDKGRNLVVSYIRAGTPLPTNFEKIALGKKEIKAIQAVRPDWVPHY